MRCPGGARVITLTLAICGIAAPLFAQDDVEVERAVAAALPALRRIDFGQVIPQPAGPPPTPRHTGIKAMVTGLGPAVKHLPSRENLMWAGIGGALALSVHPLDHNVNRQLAGNKRAEYPNDDVPNKTKSHAPNDDASKPAGGSTDQQDHEQAFVGQVHRGILRRYNSLR